MSIRDTIMQRVATNAPPGTNVEQRSRQLMHTLITRFWPKVVPIDVSTLPVCEWDEADAYVYLGRSSSIMFGGFAFQLRYGQRYDRAVAEAIRLALLEIVPVRGDALVERPPEGSSVTDGGDLSDAGSEVLGFVIPAIQFTFAPSAFDLDAFEAAAASPEVTSPATPEVTKKPARSRKKAK